MMAHRETLTQEARDRVRRLLNARGYELVRFAMDDSVMACWKGKWTPMGNLWSFQ